MPYIKDVLIDVIEEVNAPESSTTTDHALEDGEQITDHIKSDPIYLTISGVILDDTEQKVLKLREYREKGELLTFDYMTSLKNVVITSFDRDYSSVVKDGYAFTMTLKQIKTAEVADYVAVSVTPAVKRQVKPVAKKGRQQPKKTQTAKAKATKEFYVPKKKIAGGTGAVMTQ